MELQRPDADLLYLVLKGGRDEALAKQLLPKKRVLTLQRKRRSPSCAALSTGDLLRWTNLKAVAKAAHLGAFMLSHRGTHELTKWSQTSKIPLISTSLKDQLHFEDKIWFDRLLAAHRVPKPKSKVLRASVVKTLPFPGRVVLQKPLSFGGVGTFFLDRPSGLRALLGEGLVSKGERLLARAFLPGKTYGITIWIGHDTVACSALREQCFFPESKKGVGSAPEPRIFAGVQWIPTASLGSKVSTSISAVFSRLGRVFHKKRFFGFANFDFIVTPEGHIAVLECNPRLSSATPQLVAVPELIHNLPVGKWFIEETLTPKPYARTPKVFGLPAVAYQGALFDIPAWDPLSASVPQALLITREPQIGRYFKSASKFLGPNLQSLRNRAGEFMFFSEHKKGERVTVDETIGTIISHRRLFRPSGMPSAEALQLMREFQSARSEQRSSSGK